MTWQPLFMFGKPVFDSEYLGRALDVAAQKMDSICNSPDVEGFRTIFQRWI